MTGPVTATLVEPGWQGAYELDGSDGARLLTYLDGTVRFEHTCDRGRRGVIVCAPALQIGNGHTLTIEPDGTPTVRASIACPDCGVHGFVTAGRWEPC